MYVEASIHHLCYEIVYVLVCTVRWTDGCSGSAIASLVTRAHSYVVVQAGERGLVKHVQKDVIVTMNHFLHAIEDVRSRLQNLTWSHAGNTH